MKAGLPWPFLLPTPGFGGAKAVPQAWASLERVKGFLMPRRHSGSFRVELIKILEEDT